MNEYELSDEAQIALEEVVRYTFAKFGRKQAERAAEQVFKAAERLAAMPETGHTRTDLTEEAVLFWTIPKYRVTLIYKPEASPLSIVHIVGPGKNVSELFGAS